jgi:uncharacterized repeat protein (TIGR01451 family)
MFPTDDADYAEDIECRTVLGSFDPNAKSAFPVGYEPMHYIERGTEIEYLVQFQNTGTDTAFTVIVRDTLSEFLNPASVQVGAASHNFTWDLEGRNILVFKFLNILLPDSNVNESASHGWLSFRIAQKPGLSLGSRIENQAAIFFDYNSPVFTETVFHTIGENFVSVSIDELEKKLLGSARVFPNPAQAGSWLVFENEKFSNMDFRVFNIFGQEIFKEKIEAGRVFLPAKMGTGMFVFRVEDSGKIIGSGRLVAKAP